MYTTKMLIDVAAVKAETTIGVKNTQDSAEFLMYKKLGEIINTYLDYISNIAPIFDAKDMRKGYDVTLRSGDTIIIMIKKEG